MGAAGSSRVQQPLGPDAALTSRRCRNHSLFTRPLYGALGAAALGAQVTGEPNVARFKLEMLLQMPRFG